MLRDLNKSKTNQKESGDPQSTPTAHNFVCFDLIPAAKRHGHRMAHVLRVFLGPSHPFLFKTTQRVSIKLL